ncbi:hypothetical protein [Mesorhizobium sp. CA4]|uniref:hypothetical protein n=1 Tax=Mesorhizobium sp. CA4 TaxID=588499 RepID=UPI001CD1233F|nr:hypothetical protein [Mesorhizobium sp. CA4]MBZ9822362.1 hypothetical protein [Mesorhizobium sp. CA4]
MAWFGDLSSVLGMPVGGALAAAALYHASTVAEKEASRGALRDVACIIKDPSWSRAFRPSAAIERLFCLTFGERHLSWKCIRRSLYATLIFTLSLSLQFCIAAKVWPEELWQTYYVKGTIAIVAAGFFADYVALWKTRRLLFLVGKYRSVTFILLILDILSSIFISLVMMTAFDLAETFIDEPGMRDMVFTTFIYDEYQVFLPRVTDMIGLFNHDPQFLPLIAILQLSTLVTSAWMLIILLSGTILKLLEPLRRFANWFFPIEEHPIRAIGVVAASLVCVGSLLATLI